MLFKYLFLLLFLPFFLHAAPGYWEPWGKDADLKIRKEEKEPSTPSFSPLVFFAEKVISFHQNVISPVDGPRSHFRPSSSNYMLLSIKKYGFVKGFIMGCDRLLRENEDPWVYRTRMVDGKMHKWDPPRG